MDQHERENPKSGIELFQSKTDSHVRIKEYIVSTQEISCVYTRDSCVYTISGVYIRDLLCMHNTLAGARDPKRARVEILLCIHKRSLVYTQKAYEKGRMERAYENGV